MLDLSAVMFSVVLFFFCFVLFFPPTRWTMFLEELQPLLTKELSLVHCNDSKTLLRNDVSCFARIDGSVQDRKCVESRK